MKESIGERLRAQRYARTTHERRRVQRTLSRLTENEVAGGPDFMMALARSVIITMPAHAGPVQPFCGAVRYTSGPPSFMLTHALPEAIPSRQKTPPTSLVAAATAMQ